MSAKRPRIGTEQLWHTRAKFEWRKAAGKYVWLCHCCGYWPSADFTLPADACYNCKEQWTTTEEDPQATTVVAKVTSYGHEFLGIVRSGQVRN